MGEAYVCDRCGEYDDEPSRRVWEVDGGIGEPVFPHALIDDYYLCESCADGFNEFMEDE